MRVSIRTQVLESAFGHATGSHRLYADGQEVAMHRLRKHSQLRRVGNVVLLWHATFSSVAAPLQDNGIT